MSRGLRRHGQRQSRALTDRTLANNPRQVSDNVDLLPRGLIAGIPAAATMFRRRESGGHDTPSDTRQRA
jgi:hypothetical protein